MSEEKKKIAAAAAAPSTPKKKVIKKKIIIKKIVHPRKPEETAPVPTGPAPVPAYPAGRPAVGMPAPGGFRRTPSVTLPPAARQSPAGGPPKPGGDKKPMGGGRGRYKPYEERKHRYKDDFDQNSLAYHKHRLEEAQRILPKEITILESVTVGELAKKLNIKVGELIKKLMALGTMATITDMVDKDTATIVCDEYGVKVNIASLYEETLVKDGEQLSADTEARDPVVTVMGHVDHGKTQLLDTIRHANVREHEAGLITQHIGAYKVWIEHNGKQRGLVFLDTPGHEAFTSMRARGAAITDVVVLVVAADDGVMPQTVEALNHAKAAKVPIIVAINKIDLPVKNTDKIKQDLSQHGIISEEWGGENIFIEVSAKENTNIAKLLDSILLVTDMMERKANTTRQAVGSVIESRIDPGFGPSATILVQNGTLRTSDAFVAGVYCGRVRSMHDENGKKLESAGPSTPVVIYGIDGIPSAGDPFQVVKSDKYAREISEKRKELQRFEENKNVKKITLSNFMEKIKDGEIKELNIILKADVKGSIEAIEYSFNKLSQENDKVRVKIVHAATGAINENDVILAQTTGSVIIGFHVRPNPKAQDLASQENLEIRTYDIIYEAIDDVKKAMEGLLEPQIRQEVLGRVEVRETFKVSKIGTVAGCLVVDGKIQRNAKVNLLRDSTVIWTGTISTLKRFKDDAREVVSGMECGLTLENYNDVKIGDVLEVFVERKETPKLFS